MAGVGKGSLHGQAVVKRIAEEVLVRNGLRFEVLENNPGRIIVRRRTLEKFAMSQYSSSQESILLHGLSVWYITLFGGAFSAVSAVYLIPRILAATSVQ